jgi:hypothetical protein
MIPVPVYRSTRLTRFIDRFKNTSIEDYFEILKYNNKEKINCKTNTEVIENQNIISFEIHFFKNSDYLYNFVKLPDEINNEIYKFYKKEYINIKMNIHYGNDYPFKPPLWSLEDVKYNIVIPINLINYYTEIINNHNCINKKNWSPAIDIHHDILDLIQKINHFDYMMKSENFIY